LIGLTALALAAVAALVAAAIMLVWAAGFGVFFAFEPMVGPAWAAAIVVGIDLLVILIGFGIARLMHNAKERKEEKEEAQQQEEAPSLVGLFADAIKDRPITALLVSAVTGFVAVKNPKIFRDLVGDVLRGGRG
jgi:lysylphosphatidylglycerol synthetase-like protein (DUF2156 family)